MNKRNLILLDPANGDNNGGGGPSAATLEPPPSDVMDTVLNKLGLPKELKGEKQKAESGKQKAEPQSTAKAQGQKTTDNPPPSDSGAASKDDDGTDGTDGTNDQGQPSEAEAKLVESLSKEDQEALEAMAPEERKETIERLLKEDAEAAANAEPKEPEFTAEQKAWLDERNKETQNKLQEAEQLRIENERLKNEAQQRPMQVDNQHPLLSEDDPAKIEAADAELAAFERWALANWDGSEEVPATDKSPGIPAYTGAQIRERYAAVKEMREKVVPAAWQALQTRGQWREIAKKQYPELFDPKRQEAQTAENILRKAPGLKAIFPSIHIIIGDAIVGERIRLEKAKQKAGKNGTKNGTNRIAPRVAPKPGAGGNRINPNGGKKKDDGITAKRFREMGGDRNALISMLKTADLPIQSAGVSG